MHERRRTVRRRGFLKARIVFNNMSSTMDCTVGNLSECGALLRMPSTLGAPSEFTLHLLERRRTYAGRMIWRDWERLGLEFIHEANNAFKAAAAEGLRQVDELKDENAVLRDQLSDTHRRV
jgi:hypothetical protein